MKQIIVLILAGIFGIANAEIPFEDVDFNQDGVVTNEEITRAVKAHEEETVLDDLDWDASDTDESGTLSKEEYRAAVEILGKMEYWDASDTDESGTLSKEEYRAAVEILEGME